MSSFQMQRILPNAGGQRTQTICRLILGRMHARAHVPRQGKKLESGQLAFKERRPGVRGLVTARFPPCFHMRVVQLTTKLYGRGNTCERQRFPMRVMATDRMEITDEQIYLGKQQSEEQELFLGKEGLSNYPENDEEDGPEVGAVGAQMRECWDLWQRIGLPVQKIAKERHMTQTGVFFCIFTCIQNNYTVDWFELCKEAEFTLHIAKRMIESSREFLATSEGRPVETRALRQHLPSDVSEVHFGLYMTMLARGLPDDTILEVSVQPRDTEPQMEWGEVYNDEERFPREATRSNVLQWLSQKDGVSLIEIALKFRECDDLHLMRLVLSLEEEGKIFWRQGIFRVT